MPGALRLNAVLPADHGGVPAVIGYALVVVLRDVRNAADGCEPADAAVGSVVIVFVEPSLVGRGAFGL